jgi:hypothetical protein
MVDHSLDVVAEIVKDDFDHEAGGSYDTAWLATKDPV